MDSVRQVTDPSEHAASTPVLPYGLRRPRPLQTAAICCCFSLVAVLALWASTPALKEWAAERAEIRYQIDTNLDKARADIGAKQCADAQLCIDRARLAAAADPTIFSRLELLKFRSRIDEVEGGLRCSMGVSQAAFENQLRLRGCNLRSGIICIRTGVVQDLIRTADDLLRGNRDAEAMMTVDQILILDPENARGLELRAALLARNPATTLPTECN